ncbi:MAG: hypothetical protein ACJ8GN_24515 [Longimicrobiaceae bacterium]
MHSDNPEDDATAAPESAPAAAPDLDLAELRELKRSLMLATQVMTAQSSRSTELRAAIEDVNAVTRAMMVAPAPMSRSAYEGVGERDCGCGPCDCVAEGCCAFTVKMSHVRVIDMQLEPLDSNIAQMEVRMFASIGGIGAVIPDLTGVLSLHKLVNKPGVWIQVHRPIGTVYVCKGQPKTVNIECTAVEVEDTIVEQAANLRDEYGTASTPMTLDCCCSTPPVVSFEIDFTGGGQGGGTIEVKFTAEKAC